MSVTAVILAAGKGKRFGKSTVNKTATKAGDRSLIQMGIDKIENLVDEIVVVVGHKKETVINSVTTKGVIFVTQTKRHGTGHAVKIALKEIEKVDSKPEHVFVANGDHLFMIDKFTIQNLLKTHQVEKNDVTILTARHNKPDKLHNGRIIRKRRKITSILEKECFTHEIRSIKELNTGTYIFKYNSIKNALSQAKIIKGEELYITKVLFNLSKIGSYTAPFSKVGSGVNTKKELEEYLIPATYTNMKKKSYYHHIVELFVVIAILVVLLGKLLFKDENATLFLASYGIVVSLVMCMSFIISFHFYKDPYELALKKERKHPESKKYLVSCMVAVKNEEENISRCVDSMLRQTYKNKEIIVVNDASTDKTLDVLKEYKKTKKIKLINITTNVGKKKALGKAMATAKGDIFAHTDSDSVWAPDAIEKVVKVFKYFPEVGAISGHGRALNRDKNILTKVQDSWMEGQFSIRKAFESVFGAVTCVSGPLAVFRKEAVYNFIPAWESDAFLGQEFKFATDRTMTGFVLGSNTIGEKLKKKYKDSPFIKSHNYPTKDWKVVYCKSAKSWTIVPDTFKRLINQQIRWKKSFIRNIFFTGLFYWQKPLPTATVYYLHILFVLMGPFISFRHLVYLPIRGDIVSAVLYLSGITFMGFMFGLAFKLENKDSQRWVYRPIMSLFSTLIISWLIFYSAITIRRMVWSRT